MPDACGIWLTPAGGTRRRFRADSIWSYGELPIGEVKSGVALRSYVCASGAPEWIEVAESVEVIATLLGW